MKNLKIINASDGSIFFKICNIKQVKAYTHIFSLQICCATKFVYESCWANNKIYRKKIMEFRLTQKPTILEEKVLLTVNKGLNLIARR